MRSGVLNRPATQRTGSSSAVTPPQRAVLPGTGTPLTVSGYVFGLACQPLANVLLDFWPADRNGAYDNVTDNFRSGRWCRSRALMAPSGSSLVHKLSEAA
ncbi:hypothetical protein GCM10022224_083970 [Nonomuraea antimicrobica]|uniref:Uncharacterized protein n=1 Tax=Nonomuraea antimicrobica TaxID=561173 RepID=A0ABP7DJW2_9ACTN